MDDNHGERMKTRYVIPFLQVVTDVLLLRVTNIPIRLSLYGDRIMLPVLLNVYLNGRWTPEGRYSMRFQIKTITSTDPPP